MKRINLPSTPSVSTLPKELSDKQCVELICQNSDYVFHFLKDICHSVFAYIQTNITRNSLDFDDLVHTFYLYLRAPGRNDPRPWHRLRTFQFECSLVTWIHKVAVRYFLSRQKKEYITFEHITPKLQNEILSQIDDAKCRKLARLRYVKGLCKDDVCYIMNLTPCQYADINKQLRAQLLTIVYEVYPDKIHLLVRGRKISFLPINENCFYPTDDEEDRFTANDQLKHYLCLMTNAKYRSVVERFLYDDISPEAYAEELGISVDNMYNLKKRSYDHLINAIIRSLDPIRMQNIIHALPDRRLQNIAAALLLSHEKPAVLAERLDMPLLEYRRQTNLLRKVMREMIMGTAQYGLEKRRKRRQTEN